MEWSSGVLCTQITRVHSFVTRWQADVFHHTLVSLTEKVYIDSKDIEYQV